MDPVAKTQQGIVRGSVSNDIFSFKGIPYAAPPFGPNRLKPPQPVQSWAGERKALNYGYTVPQQPRLPILQKIFIMDHFMPGEDCLNLNVWTPELGQAHLPVLVWIHGGAFTTGSGSEIGYDGTNFARDGVVCVTINYRLGIEGFLYLKGGPANRGLLDQIAALEWVQENIAAFGGDPHNITVCGESAGAMSITTLMAMPRAKGLFQKAIVQSGAGHHTISAETALWIGKLLAEKLGIEASYESLKSVPIDQFIQVQQDVPAESSAKPDPSILGEILLNRMIYEPVIDGNQLRARPIDIIASGKGADVEVLVGSNTDEYRLFLVPAGTIGFITEDILANGPWRTNLWGMGADEILSAFHEARPEAAPDELLCAIMTDQMFHIPAIRLAEAYAGNNSRTAYLYEFAWRSPAFDGKIGACHLMEIPFVFDNLHIGDMEVLLGSDPPQEIADFMHTAWVAFAKTGNPGWSHYDLEKRSTMLFDVVSKVVDDPRASERLCWVGKR